MVVYPLLPGGAPMGEEPGLQADAGAVRLLRRGSGAEPHLPLPPVIASAFPLVTVPYFTPGPGSGEPRGASASWLGPDSFSILTSC